MPHKRDGFRDTHCVFFHFALGDASGLFIVAGQGFCDRAQGVGQARARLPHRFIRALAAATRGESVFLNLPELLLVQQVQVTTHAWRRRRRGGFHWCLRLQIVLVGVSQS